MFKVITKDSKIYIGSVASPDNQVIAADYRQVGKILNQYNVISIYGHDEMILSRGHIKGWFEI